MDEKVKDSFIITVLIIFFLLFIFSSCALVAFLFLMPEEEAPVGAPAEIPAEQPGIPEEPEPPAPAEVSVTDLERWEMITLGTVEDGCLRVAKEEAGESASLVYECYCEETVGEGRKTYRCDIDTADPFTRYFADIDCLLEEASCTIETNYGTMTLTFQEMEEWYG